MIETKITQRLDYVCSTCKHPLRVVGSALQCIACERNYPVMDGIPDFLVGDADANFESISPMARKMDFLAPIYEPLFRQRFLMKLAGAGDSSVDSIIAFHTKAMESIKGAVLDVACGPATYGRHLVSSSREVYGIDVSMGMLRQGMNYVAQDDVSGIYLARARVEELPFENSAFDGVICAGCLHLFPDLPLALCEIARAMKPGALLTAQTFVAGDTFINRFVRRIKEVRSFELPKLQQCIARAGFEDFRPKLDGVLLTFSARKMS